MMPTPNDEFSFPLLENGLDFLASAVALLSHEPADSQQAVVPTTTQRREPGSREFKYALLHLAAGIELVFKERLRREHPSQILVKPDSFDQAKYDLGDFKSVSPVQAVERLEEHGVVISDRDRAKLRQLSVKRNKAQHFSITDKPTAVLAVTSAALGVALTFIRAQLEGDGMSESATTLLADIREDLGKLKAFVNDRWVEIQSKVDAAPGAVVTCTACGEQAAIIDDGPDCAFCGYRTTAERGAEEYTNSILGVTLYETTHHGGDYPVGTCPDCSAETLVDVAPSGDMTPAVEWVCFTCAQAWDQGELDECGKCGTWIHGGPGELQVCSDCFQATVSASD